MSQTNNLLVNLDLKYFFNDGDSVKSRNSIVTGFGDVKIILAGERTILNLIQHLQNTPIKDNIKNYYLVENLLGIAKNLKKKVSLFVNLYCSCIIWILNCQCGFNPVII